MATVKYTFDNDFESEVLATEEEIERQHECELARAKDEGFAAGSLAGEETAKRSIESQVAQLLENLTTSFSELFQKLQSHEHAAKCEAAQLACTISSKLAPALMKQQPAAEIEALIIECMEFCQKEPRIIVRINDALADTIKARIDQLAANSGYPGAILVIAEPGMQEFDCRVEWPDGGLERSENEVREEIEKAVQRFVMNGGATGRSQRRSKTEVEPDITAPTDAPSIMEQNDLHEAEV